MKRRELSAAPSAVSLRRLRVFGVEGWFQEALSWLPVGARREGLELKPEGGEFPCLFPLHRSRGTPPDT